MRIAGLKVDAIIPPDAPTASISRPVRLRARARWGMNVWRGVDDQRALVTCAASKKPLSLVSPRIDQMPSDYSTDKVPCPVGELCL